MPRVMSGNREMGARCPRCEQKTLIKKVDSESCMACGYKRTTTKPKPMCNDDDKRWEGG